MGSAKTHNSHKMETLNSTYSNVEEENWYQNHHVIKAARILSTDKLSSKEIYSILISNTVNKPASNICFKIGVLKIQF